MIKFLFFGFDRKRFIALCFMSYIFNIIKIIVIVFLDVSRIYGLEGRSLELAGSFSGGVEEKISFLSEMLATIHYIFIEQTMNEFFQIVHIFSHIKEAPCTRVPFQTRPDFSCSGCCRYKAGK
jgi:hypothetical protein